MEKKYYKSNGGTYYAVVFSDDSYSLRSCFTCTEFAPMRIWGHEAKQRVWFKIKIGNLNEVTFKEFEAYWHKAMLGLNDQFSNTFV